MTDEHSSSARTARDLRIAIARIRRRMRDISTDDELSPLQTAVIIDLDKGDANSASALAALEGVRPQTMATAIDALQARGLVRRRPDPDDGRRQLIELTDLGRDLERGHGQSRREWLAHHLEAHTDEAERRTLAEAARLLERLAQAPEAR